MSLRVIFTLAFYDHRMWCIWFCFFFCFSDSISSFVHVLFSVRRCNIIQCTTTNCTKLSTKTCKYISHQQIYFEMLFFFLFVVCLVYLHVVCKKIKAKERNLMLLLWIFHRLFVSHKLWPVFSNVSDTYVWTIFKRSMLHFDGISQPWWEWNTRFLLFIFKNTNTNELEE